MTPEQTAKCLSLLAECQGLLGVADEPECEWGCKHEGVDCGTLQGGLVCTRKRGHAGEHVACGWEHAIHRWPQEPEQPAEPDRTGQCFCLETASPVWRVTGPPVQGMHPDEMIWAPGPDFTLHATSGISEAAFRDGWALFVPPMPTCPADKRLTGIVLEPKDGDNLVSLGYKFVENWCAGRTENDPLYGTRRWGWEYVEQPAGPLTVDVSAPSKWDGPKHPSQMSRREHREWIEKQLVAVAGDLAMLWKMVESIDRRLARLEGERP